MFDLELHLKVLDDTCREYTLETRGISAHICMYYVPQTGRRCAIGRLLTIEQAKYLTEKNDWIDELLQKKLDHTDEFEAGILNTLSKYDLGFLKRLQVLHDKSCNWSSVGLSYVGVKYVDEIRDYLQNKSKQQQDDQNPQKCF